MLVGGKYKVRGIIDSGSTSTIISTALLEKMPEVYRRVLPTSLTYVGVNEERQHYHGLLQDLDLMMTPEITVRVVAAVVQNTDPMILIGQDVLGGSRSKLKTVALNTDYSFYTVVDEATGSIGNLHYIKNVEVPELPPPMNRHSATEAPGPSKVAQLFR